MFLKKIIVIPFIYASLFLISLGGCKNVPTTTYNKATGYDLAHPDRVIQLPDVLHEISGITLIDSVTIACVQDENGILFIYDIAQNNIKAQHTFYENGDYEGICHVDTTIFILRSDGALFEISNYKSSTCKLTIHPTQMLGSNNEGLCYDNVNNRLLIARKNKLAKGREFKSKRAIYAFDLKTKTQDSKPVFEFDVDTIKKMASQEKIVLPTKGKKKGKGNKPTIRFASSEIAIHPITKKLFLLSSMDYLLFVINEKGSIEHMEKLNPIIFKKPEGIAFQKNGNMLITNEGQNQKPTLLQFTYH